MTALMLLLLAPLVFANPNARKELLEQLVQPEVSAPTSNPSLRLVPEQTELDRMYNISAGRINSILESRELTSLEKSVAMETLRKSSPTPSETQFLIEWSKRALQADPIDWEALRKCFIIGESGHADSQFLSIAISLVSFQSVPSENVSVEQITVTLAALTMLARLDWPGRRDFMLGCADGSQWQTVQIQSVVRPDLPQLLQNHSILNIAALPAEHALGLIQYLEQRYPASKFIEGADDGPLALSVAILKADVARRQGGHATLVEGIR